MQPAKLTVRLLERLKPNDRVTDTEVKGLFAEAGKTGRIKLKFKGKLPDRSTFKQTLGEYPGLSLDGARKQALELRLKLKGREDPRAGTSRAPGMWTVGALVAEYLEDLRKTGGAERTISDIQTRYADHLEKPWATLPLASVTALMARERHEQISRHGKNGDTPAPVVANDTLRNFRAMWNWARKTQPHLQLGDNPVNAVTFNKQRQRTDSLTIPDLQAWEVKVAAIKNPIRRDMHRFGLFSGLRPGTLVVLERSWVRFEQKVIVIPADVMKARKEFHLPLSDHMMALLRRIMAAGDVLFPGSQFLFPTRGNKTRIGPVIATQVWKEKGMANETGHILRHIYSNACQAAGASGSAISQVERMLLLGQTVPGIAGTYLNDKFLIGSLLAKQDQVTVFLLEATSAGPAPKAAKKTTKRRKAAKRN